MFTFIYKLYIILQGWFNLILSSMFIKRPSFKVRRRIILCKKCGFNRKGVCMICGCVLKAKVSVDYIEDSDGRAVDGCPLKKW